MPISKKDEDNTRDGAGGGVLAAVKRDAIAAFTSDNVVAPPKSPPSAPSLPPFQSPILDRASPPPDVNPGPSPILDAVSTTSYAASIAPSPSGWAKGIPGLSGSPGNLISVMGDSPPTQPSSYEDRGSISGGWIPPQRTFMNTPPITHTPLSASPTPSQPSHAVKRPLSFQLAGQLPQPESYSRGRGSMNSQFSPHPRTASNPPLPHQPQPHFYGAPDIDVTIGSKAGMKAGERGYHFSFDTLTRSGGEENPGSDNVVLAGYEGGLDVFSVSKRGVDLLASLKGLRGGVYNAKVLPWTTGTDALVAVVIHGPVLPAASPNSDGPMGTDVHTSKLKSPIEAYQTTVEVYSLKTSERIDTLLEAPKTTITVPFASPTFKIPSPSGAFCVHADGRTVVVASGVTGECWVYRHVSIAQDQGPQFLCAGKLWTTLQQSPKVEPVNESDSNKYTVARRPSPQTPVVALNGRWIAHCPPNPSSQISMKAVVPVHGYGKAPGLTTMAPPHLPVVNSDLDIPGSESVVNQIMRQTTQELITGAKWVGAHGKQMWNSYWNKGSPQQARSPPAGHDARADSGPFPPTHGAPAPAVNKDPGLVSIVDTHVLGSSSTVHPIVTFSPQNGCSFLSFTPNGLALFTASTKGDVQTLWDLMRIQFTKSSPLQASLVTNLSGPRVRQISQFSRMTVARIVDITWTKPNGERLAIVTERGTVHLHDVPAGAYSWPPPRRRVRLSESRTSVSEGSTSATSAAVSIASSALSTAASVARPLIVRPRRSSLQMSGTTTSSIMEHASHGSKVIAASISNSLGKTGSAINQLRHNGENRVALPYTAQPAIAGCVTWIADRSTPILYVLGDGLVRSFPGKSRKPNAPADKNRVRSSYFKDMSVPPLPDDRLAPAVKAFLDQEEYLDLTDKDMDGGNTMVLETRARPRIQMPIGGIDAAIPQAEIESSAPYQPFHTDRRVAMFNYVSSDMSALMSQFASASLDDTPADASAPRSWAFGDDIPATKLDLGSHHDSNDDDEDLLADGNGLALPASAMERVRYSTDNGEQIVMTTRRRRAPGNKILDEDGFFEEDCMVLDFADQRV